jgi:hypothetical protein
LLARQRREAGLSLEKRIGRLENRRGEGSVRFVIRPHGYRRPAGEEEPEYTFTLKLGDARPRAPDREEAQRT